MQALLDMGHKKGGQNDTGSCKFLLKSDLANSHCLKTSKAELCCVLSGSFAKSSAVSEAFLCVSHAIGFKQLADLVRLCEASIQVITSTSPQNTSKKNIDEYTWSQKVKCSLIMHSFLSFYMI